MLTTAFSINLPDDLFGPGEIKPRKSAKAKKANGAGKKRPVASVEEAVSRPIKRVNVSAG